MANLGSFPFPKMAGHQDEVTDACFGFRLVQKVLGNTQIPRYPEGKIYFYNLFQLPDCISTIACSCFPYVLLIG